MRLCGGTFNAYCHMQGENIINVLIISHNGYNSLVMSFIRKCYYSNYDNHSKYEGEGNLYSRASTSLGAA